MMEKGMLINHLTRYKEVLVTGTGDMIKRCSVAGLAEPELSVSDGFVKVIYRKPAQAAFTGEVTGEVAGGVTGEVRQLLAAIKAKEVRE